MEPLSRISRTFGVNLRAMGRSTEPSDHDLLSMKQAVIDLEAVRHSLGVDPWIFVGCSAGGFLGMQYALEFPDGLRGLVLVGTAPSFRVFFDPSSIYCQENPHYASVQSVIGTQAWSETVWPLIAHSPELVASHAEELGQISEARQRAMASEMRAYDLEKNLARIATPTLVIHGRFDTSMPFAQGQIIAAGVPNARLEIFEQSGHFPWWEEEAAFERSVRAFSVSRG